MRKSSLAIGTILSITAPVAAAISCTLVRNDKMEDYIELPSLTNKQSYIFANSETMSNSLNDLKNGGTNFAVNDTISQFTKNKTDIVGTLNYRTNTNGIILSDAWGKGDIQNLANLFQAMTWFNDKDMEGLDLNLSQGADQVKAFLNMLNIRHGIRFNQNDEFQSYFNGRVNNLRAWSDNNATDIFDKDLISIDDSGDTAAIKTKVASLLNKIQNTYAASTGDKIQFTPKSNLEFDFYYYMNRAKNRDYERNQDIDNDFVNDSSPANPSFKALEDPNTATSLDKIYHDDSDSLKETIPGHNYEFDVYLNSMRRFFASAGINLKMHVKDKLNDLVEIANSKDAHSIVFMPIDIWAQNRKGGSLILQERKESTIGESLFDINNIAFKESTIKVDESKTLHSILDFQKALSQVFSSGHFGIKNFITALKDKKTDNTFTNSLYSSTMFSKKQVDAMLVKLVNTNVLPTDVKISNESGKIDILNPTLYTRYLTKYVTIDYALSENPTAALFTKIVSKYGPSLSNNYDWTINTRESLPLPIKVGGLAWNEEHLNDNITNWINQHFTI